jgi:hypothetical protein
MPIVQERTIRLREQETKVSIEHKDRNRVWELIGISVAPGQDWWAVLYDPQRDGEEERLAALPVVGWRVATFQNADGELMDELAPLVPDSEGICLDAYCTPSLVGIYRRDDVPTELLPKPGSYADLLKTSREVFAERMRGDRTAEDADAGRVALPGARAVGRSPESSLQPHCHPRRRFELPYPPHASPSARRSRASASASRMLTSLGAGPRARIVTPRLRSTLGTPGGPSSRRSAAPAGCRAPLFHA